VSKIKGTFQEYIVFLTDLEDLGKSLSLNLDIKSVESSLGLFGTKTVEPSNTLGYSLNFYGSFSDLEALLDGLVDMPYYIKVEKISYESLASQEESKNKTTNINVIIKLYVK